MARALKRLRKRADLTQDQAAEKADVVPQSWRRYEWGERDLPLDKWIRLAEAIGFTRDDLIAERDSIAGDAPPAILARPTVIAPRAFSNPEPPSMVLLPVRDRAQAGAWLMADDYVQDWPRTYPSARDPRYSHADQWLTEVVGDSVNKLNIFSGDFAHCVDFEAIGRFPKTGDIVEVERLRAGERERELTIKQVEVSNAGLALWPRSTNPNWQEPLQIHDGVGENEDIHVRIRGLVIAVIRQFQP